MTDDPLEIRRLRYFLAVAEAGSFSRAWFTASHDEHAAIPTHLTDL